MSAARASNYDKRLGKVENELARHGERFEGLAGQVERLETVTEKTSAGVEELLRRDATRPQPFSWRTALGTFMSICSALAVVGGFTWWWVATSPAVVNLDRRVDHLDHPVVGRVPRLERRTDELEQLTWPARVTRN